MNAQNPKQTKRLECHPDMTQVVLIVSSFNMRVSIKQKCLTMIKIEIKYANRTNQLEIATDAYNLIYLIRQRSAANNRKR
jgi:hypothetical protein